MKGTLLLRRPEAETLHKIDMLDCIRSSLDNSWSASSTDGTGPMIPYPSRVGQISISGRPLQLLWQRQDHLQAGSEDCSTGRSGREPEQSTSRQGGRARPDDTGFEGRTGQGFLEGQRITACATEHSPPGCDRRRRSAAPAVGQVRCRSLSQAVAFRSGDCRVWPVPPASLSRRQHEQEAGRRRLAASRRAKLDTSRATPGSRDSSSL